MDIYSVVKSSDTKLQKNLTTFDLTMLGIGAIIGTGIFVLTGTGALKAGPGLMTCSNNCTYSKHC